jgi:hypothetical protein
MAELRRRTFRVRTLAVVTMAAAGGVEAARSPDAKGDTSTKGMR